MAKLLELDGVWAGYGEAAVLEDISFTLEPGASLALLGRNGMGKTTLLATLMGAARQSQGSLRFDGRDLKAVASHRRAHAGLGWVPQERDIFASLSVEENLTVVARPGPWDLKKVYATFPRLQERRANMGNQLSGGEQQMLSIGRALMTNPDAVILDEATEGLAPLIVAEIWRVIASIRRTGIATLIVDRDYRKVCNESDRLVVMQKGRIVLEGPSEALRGSSELAGFLGV